MLDKSNNDDRYDRYDKYNKYDKHDRGYYYHNRRYKRKTSLGKGQKLCHLTRGGGGGCQLMTVIQNRFLF